MSPEGKGVFVAVVGPSGAGKDTILAMARERLASETGFSFVRRVITRPAQADAEDHDTLDEAGFEAAEASGAFALSWGAHGLFYGLPVAALNDVRNGRIVVANVSRRLLGQAAEIFGLLAVLEIAADPALLARRIAARGREDAAVAATRLARQVPLALPERNCVHFRIDNSGRPETAAAAFVSRLTELRERSNRASVAGT